MSLYIYCTCTACIYIWKLTKFINYSKNILVVCNAFHHHYSSNNAHPFVSAFENERFKFKQKLINLTLFLWHFHAEIYGIFMQKFMYTIQVLVTAWFWISFKTKNKHLYQTYNKIQNPYFFQTSYNVLQKYVSLTLGYHWTVVFLLWCEDHPEKWNTCTFHFT